MHEPSPISILIRLSLLSWLILSLLLFSSAVFADPRNVILITIDTLRFDYVSYSGAKKVQTPSLDSLASKGVYFEQARTPIPLTTPSHSSILTGLYPPAHGVRDNGTYRLDEEHTTIAEVFRKHNYFTAAFVGSFLLDHRFGVAQGFDLYDDKIFTEASTLENREAERTADEVSTAFLKSWKRISGKQPFFLWVHFYDPHAPYKPPTVFDKRYPKNPYAGEVAYVDAVLGKILDILPLQKSIIAVVGDHGEGLGDHRENTHSVLIYNSTLHVPMLIVAPGLIPAESRVDALCRTIDLAPTLLDYAGFPQKFGQGISLRSMIEKKKTVGEDAYSESLYPKLDLGWSELRGLEEGRYHFILAPKPELYDVSKDPAETANIIQQFPQVAEQMKKKLQTMMGHEQASQVKGIDAETAEKLRSLGYVSGSTRPKTGGAVIDPKDKMDVWNEIQLGLLEYSEGKYAIAADRFEKIRPKEKQNLLLYDYLCSCYVRLNKTMEAEQCYRQALYDSGESSSFYMRLGLLHFNEKKSDVAEQELEKAIAIDPLNVEAHYYLGNVFRARNEAQKAEEHYQQALKINPSYVYAINGLAMTYAALQKNEEALRLFQQAVGVYPEYPGAHFNLAVQLQRMNRKQEAIAEYKKFLALAHGEMNAAQRKKAQEAITRLGS